MKLYIECLICLNCNFYPTQLWIWWTLNLLEYFGVKFEKAGEGWSRFLDEILVSFNYTRENAFWEKQIGIDMQFSLCIQWCRIIVPPELGYPENDYNKSGPRPTTFSVIIDFCWVINSQWTLKKMQCKFVSGATSFGFCAEEPRVDRQDSPVWYWAVEDYTKLIGQILHLSRNISIWILQVSFLSNQWLSLVDQQSWRYEFCSVYAARFFIALKSLIPTIIHYWLQRM